ncbi:MAG: hypothetical protein AB7V37_10905, partial [Eubacteriaceae bacterium]
MIEKNTIVESILINAPFEMVSGFASDNQNWCSWNPNYSDFHYLSGAGEVGSKYEANLSVAGLVYDNISEIRKIEKDQDEYRCEETFYSKNLADPDDTSTGYVIETIRRAPVGTSVTLEHHFDGDHENRLALEL